MLEDVSPRRNRRTSAPHPLIPAKAGIQSRLLTICDLGPRLRGDERILECLRNSMPDIVMEAFDLYSPEIDADPFPHYQILREQYPCYWSESGKLWILSRYDDIVEATRDWQTFSS